MSIKKTLHIMLIIFSVLPILVGSIITYSYSTDKMLSIQKENLLQIANNSGNSLNAIIEAQKSEIELLVTQKQIKRLLKAHSYPDTIYLNEFNSAMDLLNDRSNLYSYCDQISVYNKDNKMVLCSVTNSINKPNEEILDKMKSNPSKCQFSDTMIVPEYGGFKYNVNIGMAVLDSDKSILGYVITSLNTSYYQDYFYNLSLNDNSYGMIINDYGKIINHTQSELIGSVLRNEDLKLDAIQHASNDTMESGYLTGLHGSNLIYTYSTVPDLNWVIIIVQNASAVNELARMNLIVIIASMIIMLLVAFFISSLFSKIYTRPILQLRDAMRSASDGNLDVQCHITSKNEFGELSKKL